MSTNAIKSKGDVHKLELKKVDKDTVEFSVHFELRDSKGERLLHGTHFGDTVTVNQTLENFAQKVVETFAKRNYFTKDVNSQLYAEALELFRKI
ncbi:MAG: hypothetical protein ACREBF_01570 [Candidatus Micrarchaeales archaeon]